MLWDYIKEVAGASLDFARGGGEIIEIIFWIAVFCAPKIPNILSKREKQGIENEKSLRKIFIHKFLTNDGWRFAIVILGCFVFHVLVIAPYLVYTKTAPENEKLRAKLNDKSPKLDGFIDQYMLFDETGTTNTIIIPQIHINNFGGSGSLAENFKLKLILATNNLRDGKPIDFSDYYQWQAVKGDQITVFRLSRHDLISEKTSTAIESGFGPRGWLAYRVPGILSAKQKTNFSFLISFMDVSGTELFVTNGVWKGKSLTNMESFDIPRTLPGSVNLVYTNYQLQSDVANGWRPPELPPGCTNVVIFFGTSGFIYPRFMAGISSEKGAKFAIKDLPDYFLTGLETAENYSPRQRDLWLKYTMGFTIGGKTVPYPILPIIISNHLFVEVEMPFSNEKRKLIMSDSFDPELPIPPRWDRNYSTNYDAYRGIYFYEVVNELTNPVLQVFYTAPNEVHVYGIFKVDDQSTLVSFGQPPQLLTFSNKVFVGLESTQRITTVSLQSSNFLETLAIYTNDSIASIGEMYTNEFYRPIFPGQRAIFKYPSNRNNIGAFADWFMETNKSDTK